MWVVGVEPASSVRAASALAQLTLLAFPSLRLYLVACKEIRTDGKRGLPCNTRGASRHGHARDFFFPESYLTLFLYFLCVQLKV